MGHPAPQIRWRSGHLTAALQVDPGQQPAPPPSDLPPPPVDDEPIRPPPKRASHATGKRGRRAFHRERRVWYERATGRKLTGTLAEENEQFDKVARRFRAYTDYRAHRSIARFTHECEHGPDQTMDQTRP